MPAQKKNSDKIWPMTGIQPSTMLATMIASTPYSQNSRREMRPDGEVNSLIQYCVGGKPEPDKA